jgi:hypothetical protein
MFAFVRACGPPEGLQRSIQALRALTKAGMPPPGQGETAPEGCLFGDHIETKPLMAIPTTANLGCFPGEGAGEVDRG